MLLGIVAYYVLKPDPQKVIQKNQAQAIEHLKQIGRALQRWRRSDYDANGRPDLPLGPLNILRESQLINGQPLNLIPKTICAADLRHPEPIPLDGYLFTLIHPDQSWPDSIGTVSELAILAKPALPGRTGSCTFYVNTQGEAFFSNCLLPDKVPKWPDARQLEAKIWEVLPAGTWLDWGDSKN
jgi:hypothetical protein